MHRAARHQSAYARRKHWAAKVAQKILPLLLVGIILSSVFVNLLILSARHGSGGAIGEETSVDNLLATKTTQLLPRRNTTSDQDIGREARATYRNSSGNLSFGTSYEQHSECKINSIAEMDQNDVNPTKGNRHMVKPPTGPILLVCCRTTKGFMNIAVHPTWAPLGADRFLSMVRSGYFSSRVPLMRCVRNFICQFGIAGIPEVDKGFKRSIPDDPNWLPEGPPHRENEMGIKRFAKGYFAYAGSGKNSRSNQLIVALADNRMLGGGSPWEVPFGEAVGEQSFETLSSIYTGYGEKGPSQALLHREGASETVSAQFPLLDYITSCSVIDEGSALQ